MTQNEGINIKFSYCLSIFDNGYPEIDEQEKYKGSTGKVKDIQGPQAHAGHNFLILDRKSLDFDNDDSQYFI